jgi:hypothetical protein
LNITQTGSGLLKAHLLDIKHHLPAFFLTSRSLSHQWPNPFQPLEVNYERTVTMAPKLPKTYKAMAFTEANKPLVEKEMTLELPKAGQVLVKVLAVGVCHSDLIVQSGAMGPLPRVPGHETVGDIVAVGEGVTKWKVC